MLSVTHRHTHPFVTHSLLTPSHTHTHPACQHTHGQAHSCLSTRDLFSLQISHTHTHTHNVAAFAHTFILSLESDTPVDVMDTPTYPETHAHPLSHLPAFSSSQLCLIFLQHTKARATSSTTRQMESPTVTHRASGGKVMGCPGRGDGENGERLSCLTPSGPEDKPSESKV